MIENTVQILGSIHQKDHGGKPTPWQGFTLDYTSTYFDEHLQQRTWRSRVHVFAQGKHLRELVADLNPGEVVLIHGELIQRHPLTRSSGSDISAKGLGTAIRLKDIIPLTKEPS